MPAGDIFTHKDGGFIIQTGKDATKDFRITKSIDEARLIKQQIGAIQQQTQARADIAQAGADPLIQQAQQQAGQEAQKGVGSAIVGAAPALGAALGTAALGVPGLAGGAIRAGAQGGAELLRQKIQGEETDFGKAGMATGLSGLTDALAFGGKRLIQGLMSKSPGLMARVSEQKVLDAKEAIAQQGLAVNKKGVSDAYTAFSDILKQQGAAPVDLAGTKVILKDVVDEMKRRPLAERQGSIMTKFSKMSSEIKGGPGGQPISNFGEVAELLKDTNAALSAARNPNERRLLIQAKQAIYNDIDNAAVPPAQKRALQQATQLAKEAFAKGDLSDAIEAGIKRSNITGKPTLNPKSILDRLDDLKQDPLFVNSFKKGELEKVENMFVQMAQSLRGSSAEGTAIILGGLGGAAGSGIAYAAGGSPRDIGLAAAAGAAGGVSIPSLFTKLALNDKIAPYLIKLVGEGKEISIPVLRALAGVAKPSSLVSIGRGASAGASE